MDYPAHESGTGGDQLQLATIQRLFSYLPPHIATRVYHVSEKHGLGNVCYAEVSGDECLGIGIDSAEQEVDFSSFEIVDFDEHVEVQSGRCALSGKRCTLDRQCKGSPQIATQEWGPSGTDGSRCPLLDNDVCPPTYRIPTESPLRSEHPDRCIAIGVNTREFLVADPMWQETLVGGVFPIDTPASPNTDRPTRFSIFCQTLQHEINHAIHKYIVGRDTDRSAREIDLIERACKDQFEYLHPRHTFCGNGIERCKGNDEPDCEELCNPDGSPEDPNCTQPTGEFFAGISNLFLADTQTLLNLARKRWMDGPRRQGPIHQFLFFARVYISDIVGDLQSGEPVNGRLQFFYQERFTNYEYNSTRDNPRDKPHGVGQYRAFPVAVVLDHLSRIVQFRDTENVFNVFTYIGDTDDIATWEQSPGPVYPYHPIPYFDFELD